MRYTLQKTVRKNYIEYDIWSERCGEQLLVFGSAYDIIDTHISCEDCDLCFPIKHCDMSCGYCMFHIDILPRILR